MNMMAIPHENVAHKNLEQNSVHQVFPFTVDCALWWNSNERRIPQSASDNTALKLESTGQLFHNSKQLGLQLPDQESSSAQSISRSLHKLSAVEGQNTQEHCISSDSGQDENCSDSDKNQLKPVIMFGHPEFMINPPQVDSCLSMARVSYPYVDPTHFGGLYNVYGRQVLNQVPIGPDMVGMAPVRVPLPLSLAEDEPIYVNAKQYHGILRRRQSRAKLEAKKRVIRNRKPYLHESRHLHALNRMRGSGGRFLSMKKNQQPDHPTPPGKVDSTIPCQMKDISEFSPCDSETGDAANCSEITSISNGSVTFRQPGSQFSTISSGMGGMKRFSEGLMHGGTQNHASVVQ